MSKEAVLALNFGEPEEPTEEAVLPFLERIFRVNARLEEHHEPEEARRRSRELAEQRAPGLLEEYRAIGGSPLNRQARAQAQALNLELFRRGHQVPVYSAMQFTEPTIPQVIKQARADGVEHLIGLPVYPLCGPSTNVASLDQVEAALEEIDWPVPFHGITGWHRHPLYLELRANGIRAFLHQEGLSLSDPEVHLVFSAHGTPQHYIDEGSRYLEYVEEFCTDLAEALEADTYELGYQNHANRGIPWTRPDLEDVVQELGGKTLVVVPVSFMHEQSETLAELDVELREEAEEVDARLLRVPIPHDDTRFPRLLADLVEPFLDEAVPESGPTGEARFDGGLRWAPCRCRPRTGTVCLNAAPRQDQDG